MKGKIKELAKIIVAVVLTIIILSLVFWTLGVIIIKIFELPINLTYLKTMGFIIAIFAVRGIIKLFIEGFDIKKVIESTKKQNIPNKKYKFHIIYKNKAETKGTLTANNLQEVKEMLLENNANFINQNKKIVYYNKDEIQFCEVEEIND